MMMMILLMCVCFWREKEASSFSCPCCGLIWKIIEMKMFWVFKLEAIVDVGRALSDEPERVVASGEVIFEGVLL